MKSVKKLESVKKQLFENTNLNNKVIVGGDFGYTATNVLTIAYGNLDSKKD